MVEKSDRAPLLDWEEIPPSDPNQAAPAPPREEDTPAEKSSLPTGPTATCTAAGTGWSSGRSTATITCSPTAVVGSTNGIAGRAELPGRKWEPVSPQQSVLFPGLESKAQWEEKDQIVAVFVVTFDTRSGEIFITSLHTNFLISYLITSPVLDTK